jgi:hypothetical protein
MNKGGRWTQNVAVDHDLVPRQRVPSTAAWHAVCRRREVWRGFPSRQAAERDEAAIAAWRQEMWRW